jgi:hypothetical protein
MTAATARLCSARPKLVARNLRIACANDVDACLAKPISAADLKILIDGLPDAKLQLEAA